MSWPAYLRGEIVLDHIKPLCRFDLNDPDQFRDAWSLSNLQPLWHCTNIRKGARTDEDLPRRPA